MIFSETTDSLKDALDLDRREMVVFVGAGGKSSALRRLARELGTGGRRVLATMTTHMFLDQVTDLGELVMHEDLPVIRAQVSKKLASAPVVAVACEMERKDKVMGPPPEGVDELWASNVADYILVEADGARGRSLKAPKEREPIIPSRATLIVPLIGVDVLGKPLDDQYVHRVERVENLVQAVRGTPVTAAMAAAVAVHPNGSAKGVPPGARFIPLINKVDGEADLEPAMDLAAEILSRGEGLVDVVVAGSCQAGWFNIIKKGTP